MAAEVVGLDGRKRDALDPLDSKDPIVALRALADVLERGEVYGPLEDWVFLFRTTSKRDSSCNTTRSADSGISASTLIQMLEATKLDILLAMRSE